MKFLTSLIIILTLSACSYRPILDQNDQYLRVGKEQADLDVTQCRADSDEYLKEYKIEKLKKETARKAVIGTGVGAVVGALHGGRLRSAAGGGLIGLGVGAVVGAISVASEDKLKPDEVKQRYINNCLNRKGYSVIGWE